LPLAFNNELKK